MKPRILLFDIETSPILSYTWGLFDQNIGLNQVHTDWFLLSWAAKWYGEKDVFYEDLRNYSRPTTDKPILTGIWRLLDEADLTITQNGKAFDHKKLNARFILNGMKPPSPSRKIDTLALAKKHFAFTSNKLAYMTDKLCTKYKKLTHHEFEGFDLWKECLAGNQAAWKVMEEYNKHDVLSLEELYKKIQPWDSTIDFNAYDENDYTVRCNCGGSHLQRRGWAVTNLGKFQRYACMECGAWTRDTKNVLSKDKKASLKRSIV